ncbi:MAG: hypothetical protein GXO79_09335 [Chlorobi bacterium]|nr:hypothetical protein [Chlorobiota bacterium]
MKLKDNQELKIFIVENIFKKDVPDIFNGSLKNNPRKALTELKQIVFIGKEAKQFIKNSESAVYNSWSDFSIDIFIEDLIIQTLKENNFGSFLDWDEDKLEQMVSAMTAIV